MAARFKSTLMAARQIPKLAVMNNQTISRKLNQQCSIFTADLQAIQDALVLISNSNQDRFTVYSDSKSALQALDLYNNSHPIVREIIRWSIYLASRHKSITLCWVPAHVKIRGRATAARRVAASDGGFFNKSIPHRDHFQLIRQAVANHWQSVWSAIESNKLRLIKNCTKPWSSSSQKNRQHEVVLARLRIGHTHLIHGFLIERGEAPALRRRGGGFSRTHLI